MTETSLLLKNIKSIYDGGPLTDARSPEAATQVHKTDRSDPTAIFIRDGMIEAIGSLDHLLHRLGREVLKKTESLDCSGTIAVPGFVDAHTHLLFSGTRENEFYLRAAGRSYLEILEAGGGIHHTVQAVREATEDELTANGLRFLDKAIRFGTTTMEIKSGYGLDMPTEEKMLRVINRLNSLHPIDIVPTFLVHTVPRSTDRKQYIEGVAREMIPRFREYADWFDIFVEKGVFDIPETEMLLRKASDAGYHLGIHVNQAYDIGGIRLALELGVRHVNHLEVLSEEDARDLLTDENVYAVFLPTAEAWVFSEKIGQIHRLLDIPNRIVLSTDFNPGSSPVLSPQTVMSTAVLRYMISDPRLLLNAFTTNPARMLYLEDRGHIGEGMLADIILFDLDNVDQIPYFGTLNLIKTVIKRGERIDIM